MSPALNRYLLIEMLRGFAAVLVCLIGIYITSRAADYLADAAAGKLQHDVVLSLVGLKLLTAMETLVPVCLYLGILLCLVRLQRDNELAAMHAAGLGQGWLVLRTTRLAMVTGALLTVSALVVSPWAERRVSDIRSQAEQESDITGIAPGRFRELSGGDRVIYVEQLSDDGTEMRDVFLHTDNRNSVSVLRARQARLALEAGTRSRWVEFLEGNQHELANDGENHAVTRFRNYRLRLDDGQSDAAPGSTKATPSWELLARSDPIAQAELQWRLAPFFVTPILCLFAVVILGGARNNRRDYSLVIALLGYFFYSNLIGVARSLLKRDQLSPWLGLWSVHVLMILLIALYWLWPRLPALSLKAMRRGS